MRTVRTSLAAVSVVMATLACTPTGTTQQASPVPSVTALRPDSSITPGVVITTDPKDVCTSGWATAHRKSLTTAQKRDVLADYGLPAGTKVSEWDHLVSLELGGGNGPANIWPQVDHSDDTRKDHLENALHRAVCK